MKKNDSVFYLAITWILTSCVKVSLLFLFCHIVFEDFSFSRKSHHSKSNQKSESGNHETTQSVATVANPVTTAGGQNVATTTTAALATLSIVPPLSCVKDGACKYIISTIAGNGESGNSGDGSAATSAMLGEPDGLALDQYNNLFVCDPQNMSVRKIDKLTNNIQTVVNNLKITSITTNYVDTIFAINNDENELVKISMNDLKNTSRIFKDPNDIISYGIAIDKNGTIYYTDAVNHLIQKIIILNNQYSLITIGGVKNQPGYDSMGAKYSNPRGMAVDTQGNIYVADTNNHIIRKITPNSDGSDYTTSVIAGKPGQSGFSGDEGPASSAILNAPEGVAIDVYGNIYISDTGNHIIRMISSKDHVITTIAGIRGMNGYIGDGTLGSDSQLNYPTNLIVDKSGNIYVSDKKNNRVRKLIPKMSTYWCRTSQCDQANHPDDAACFISSKTPIQCIYGTLEPKTDPQDDNSDKNKNDIKRIDEDQDADEITGMEKCVDKLKAVCGGHSSTLDKYKNIIQSSCTTADADYKCVPTYEYIDGLN